jgi:hypothetical protein
MKRNVVIAFCSLLLTGCELITGVTEERSLGYIGFPDRLQIAVPDTVQRGQAFTVSVRTSGSDGCWQKDRTNVTVSGLAATIRPVDVRRTSRRSMCNLGVPELSHTAQLAFATAGVAEVTIHGRDGSVTESVVVQ